MEPDQMPPKERAWACRGHRTIVTTVKRPQVLAPDGLPPVLALPAGLSDTARELAHGWAMAEWFEQRYGWLALVRALGRYEEIARIGAASGQGFAAD